MSALPRLFDVGDAGTRLDERNDLVAQVWKYAREFRPAAVLLENVPGLSRDPRLRRALFQAASRCGIRSPDLDRGMQRTSVSHSDDAG